MTYESVFASLIQTGRHPTPELAYFDPIAKSYYPDVKSLGVSTSASLELIHSWCNGNLLRDQALVEVVTKQLGNFRTAIKLSLNIAEDGCTLAKDVLFTCEKITNFFESSVEMQNDRSHVQAQVNDMLQLAKDAEARSIEAIDLFRTIRRELWPVVSDKIRIDKGQSNVVADLDKIINHVSVFVNWWTNMSLSLAYLRTVIPQIQPDGQNPFRMDSVISGWKTVQKDYSTYRITIQETLDKHNAKGSKSDAGLKDVRICVIM